MTETDGSGNMENKRAKEQERPDLEDSIAFLRNADPRNDRELIFTKMQETFMYRREKPTEIAENFPRLMDTSGLVGESCYVFFQAL